MANENRNFSLRLVVCIIIALTMIVFAIAFYLVIQINMSNMLLRAETKYLEEQRTQLNGLFDNARRNTYHIANDMALWDEAVTAVKNTSNIESIADKNAFFKTDFIEKHWPDGDTPLSNYLYNVMIVKDTNNTDLYTEYYDYANQTSLPEQAGLSVALNSLSERILALFDDLNSWPNDENAGAEQYGEGGILVLNNTAYFVAGMPIMMSRDPSDGKPVGTCFLGYVLTNSYFQNLIQNFNVTFSIEKRSDAESITRETDRVFTSLSLSDIDGDALLLVMSDARSIYTDGQRTVTLTIILMIAGFVLLAAALYIIVSRMVINPIQRLSRDLSGIRDMESVDTNKYGNSTELKNLGMSINEMLQGLSQSKISLNVFKNILNGMDSYVFVCSPKKGDILFMSDNMIEAYALTDDPIGKNISFLTSYGLSDKTREAMTKLAINQDEPVTWEEYDEPSKKTYRCTGRMILWAENRPAFMQDAADITDLKKAQEATALRLKQQELMSAISQGFISTEETDTLLKEALKMTGEFLDASAIVLTELDNSGENIVYRTSWTGKNNPILEKLPDAFAFKEGDFFYDTFITEKKPYIACSDTSRDKRLRHVANFGVKSFISVPIFISGALGGIMSVDDGKNQRQWTDGDAHLLTLISAVISSALNRSRTEKDLRLMSAIAHSSPQFISYTHIDGSFAYINPGASLITGYTRAELMKSGLSLIFDDETYKLAQGHLSIKENTVVELEIVRKDGERRLMMFNLFSPGLSGLGQGAIGMDITNMRKMESELISAKETAEQSSKAKGDFLSRMSHEMRTPMNAIIGMTKIAQSSDSLERKEYCLEKIDEASTHLLGVINDILDMSKIEAHKFTVTSEDFNFEKMLIRVTNVVNFRVEEKNQSFVVNVDPSIPRHIISDEQHLSQVITNLLSNAVKFTPDFGSITLNVYAHDLDRDNKTCTLRVEVIDSGIGISDEQLGRLFTSFEQADGGISRKYGGTGLGLAISKSIIELLDGKIWAESEEGKGSKFIFTLPVTYSGESSAKALQHSVTWDSLQILAVDDAEDVREYFVNISKALQLNTDIAASGKEACELLEKHGRYDVIFVDWKMPEMDGIELTKKIKDIYGENTVVIMISAMSWSELEHEAKAAGVDKFIAKPLFPSAIADCISELLGENQLSDQLIAAPAPVFLGKTVLLAEDIEINREIVHALLEDTGITLVDAENGLLAYQTFYEKPDKYDLIFMDLHMPEMDGYEATRKIRAIDSKKAKDIPIVAMTANVFKEDIERCIAAGMNNHIGKPLDSDELMNILKTYLV